MEEIIKACGYIRVSSMGQVEGDGFERQRIAINQYASSHNIEIVQIYEEKGVGGDAETMDRPAFIEMMIALMANGTRTVVIERLDRLSRDMIVQETAIKDFLKQGLSLLSSEVGEENLMVEKADNPTRVLVRRILGAIADYDKSMLVAKLRAARMRKKATGVRVEGPKPFGSRPGEEAAVEVAKSLRMVGKTFVEIAKAMNNSGIPARTHKAKVGKWHATSVRRLLIRCK